MISDLFQVLREGRKVPRKTPPVTVKVVQVQGVWSATCEHRVTTGCAQGLLERRGGLKWLVELSDGTHLGKAVLKVEARFNQLI